MSIVTGRRLNMLYKELSKIFKNIEKKLENVLYSTETDEHIFDYSKSGFVPKVGRKYSGEENRFLRADGEWHYLNVDDVVRKRNVLFIDAKEAQVTESLSIGVYLPLGTGILLINAYKVSDKGSHISDIELLASYAYSVAVDNTDDPKHDYEPKEIVKIAALSSGLSSTYGTISTMNQFDEGNGSTGSLLIVKANKGYAISIEAIS